MTRLVAVWLAVATWCYGQANPSISQKYDLYVIAGGFPPTLNTDDAVYDLGAGEIPEGYGYDLTKGAVLAKGTAPSGTSRVFKTSTIGTTTYQWYYQRLWRYHQTNVWYYAQFYEDALVTQRHGLFVFNDDVQPVLNIVPFGGDSMAVAKSTGSYILGNLSDTRALWSRSPLIQELRVQNTNSITELDGALYVSNVKGLLGYQDGKVVELSRKLRGNLTSVTNATLTVDYEKKYVLMGSSMVYEPQTGKFFRYSGSSFRMTTRQFHLPDWRAFTVDRLLFVIQHATTANGYLKYQVKFEDDAWSREYTTRLDYAPEMYTLINEGLEEARTVHRIQLRITDLSSGKYIKEIRLDTAAFNIDDYVQ